MVIENFYVDNKLISHLVIPESVKIIKASSFANFRGLVSITIPSDVMSIGAGAFQNCFSIAEINYNATDCKYIDKSFGGVGALNGVKIKIGATEEQWNKISIAAGNSALTNSDNIYIYSETEPAEAGNYWHYVDGEAVEWELNDDGETVE